MTCEILETTDHIIRRLYGAGHQNRTLLLALKGTLDLSSPRVQKVWPVLIDSLDETMLSHDGQPTDAEIAIFSALHFYAIQQIGATDSVYGRHDSTTNTGKPLFNALRIFRQNITVKETLDRRVQAALLTTNTENTIHAIDQLVRMLSTKQQVQKIDYAQLAQDLYWFQMSYERANHVRLKWGQQYFWTDVEKMITEEEKK